MLDLMIIESGVSICAKRIPIHLLECKIECGKIHGGGLRELGEWDSLFSKWFNVWLGIGF